MPRLSLPFVLAALVLAMPLPAQVLEALRVVPRNTQGLLVVPDPAGARAKLTAFLARTQPEGPAKDPWKELLKEYGLEALPQESRGLVVAFLPGEGQSAEPADVLVVAPGDFQAWMKALKATTKDGVVHTFKTGEKTYVAAPKGTWALVARADHGSQLKRALGARDSVLGELDELPSWMLEGDAAAVMTPKGLQTATFLARKGFAEQKAKGLKRGPGAQFEEKLEAYVHQAEREVAFIAARASLDEQGHLTGALRLKLNPSGAWAALGRGLAFPDAFGLRSLPAQPYFAAAGGSLPRPWLAAMAELGSLQLKPILAGVGMKADQIARFMELQDKTQEGFQGMGLVIPLPGSGNGTPLVRMDVEDAPATLDRQETFVKDIQPLFQAAKLASPFATRRITLEGFPGILTLTQLAKLMPPQEGAPEMPTVETGYLAPDAQTLLMGMGGTPALEAAARAYRAAESRIADDADLKATAALLPAKAHLYAFFNVAGMAQAEGQARRSPLPPEAQQDFGFPEMAAQPPVGLSFTFDLDRWELQVAFPGPLQEALGTYARAKKAAEAKERAAMEAWSKAHPAPDAPEDAED